MVAKEGSRITVKYKLFIDDPSGDLIEETTSEEPYTFVLGSGEQFEAFDKKMNGLNKGDVFSFSVACEEAFGEVDEEAIVDVPKNAFEHEGKVDDSIFELYKVLPMKDDEGNEFSGVIIALNEESITMDFNHPLAGENIWFDGEVMEVEA